jgi:hypothetical protein
MAFHIVTSSHSRETSSVRPGGLQIRFVGTRCTSHTKGAVFISKHVQSLPVLVASCGLVRRLIGFLGALPRPVASHLFCPMITAPSAACWVLYPLKTWPVAVADDSFNGVSFINEGKTPQLSALTALWTLRLSCIVNCTTCNGA